MENRTDTESRILTAAIKVFQDKGFDGTRMQEIADEAGINKSLLHYYYRSKDKLFEAVFRDAIDKFIPKISMLMASELPVGRKIEKFVENYIDLLVENPHLPQFVFHELHRNPDRIVNVFTESGLRPDLFFRSVQDEINEGKIRKIDPKQLIINVLSMCVFPFIARPVLKGFLFANDQDAYDSFLKDRKKTIIDFVISSIYIK